MHFIPLKYDFDGFTLVDTPGVNAIGGIEEVTTAFLGQANAIIYLHPIKPIESKSFSSFLANVLPEYRKDTLMLVLSHAYEQTPEEISKSLDEAKRIFSGIVPENIFAVDSLMELYREKISCASEAAIETLATEDKKFRKLTAEGRADAKGNKEKLLAIMEEEANFSNLRKRISKFSADAAALQIEDVVHRIKEVCDEIDGELDEKVKAWMSRIKSPQSFAALIGKTKTEMVDLKADLNATIDQWRSEFNLLSKDSVYACAYNKLVDGFVSEVGGKQFDSSDTAATRDSFVEKVHADIDKKIDDLAQKIAADLNIAVASKQLDWDEKYTIKVPKISLTRIWDDARSAATKSVQKEVVASGKWNTFMRIITFGRWKKTYKTVGELDIGGYWGRIQSSLIKEIHAQRTDIAKHFDGVIGAFCGKYGDKINSDLAGREKYLDELNSEKKKNEVLELELSGLKEKKAAMTGMIEKCRRQLGQL